MFTAAERTALRAALVDAAQADQDVSAAALVGSAATGREDRWSDIDLVLSVSTRADPNEVARRWTERLYADHDAAHHLDVFADGVRYRVFLLASSLQVDISFYPAERFRATQPGFQLLFGTANPPTDPNPPSPENLIGTAWLYALHVRSAIARGRNWQAVLMLDQLRDHLVALACLRHGLEPHHGRGVDRLPGAFLDALQAARPASPVARQLLQTHRAALRLLLAEAAAHDQSLADRIEPAIRALAEMQR
jgi:predicted nucleotidyltransferase